MVSVCLDVLWDSGLSVVFCCFVFRVFCVLGLGVTLGFAVQAWGLGV